MSVSAPLSDGSSVIVFQTLDGVYFERLDASLHPAGGPTLVASGAATSLSTSALANGGFGVFWQSAQGLTEQDYTASGAPAGTSHPASEPSAPIAFTSDASLLATDGSATAVLASGGYVKAWPTQAQGSGTLNVQAFTAAGQPVGAAAHDTFPPMSSIGAIGATPLVGGGYAVTFDAYSQWSNSLHIANFDANGVSLGDVDVVDYTSTPQGQIDNHAQNVTVAGLPDGGAVMAWIEAPPSGTGVGLMHVEEFAGGAGLALAPVGSALNLGSVDSQQPTRIEVLADGHYAVSWTSGGALQTQVFMEAHSASASSSPPPPPTSPPPPPASGGQVLTAQDGGSNLHGGAGDDTLIAGHGPDTLTGGGGADVFSFGSVPWNAGEITDFTPGTDKLNLSGLLSGAHYAGSDPISDGYVKLIDDGHGDSWLYFDSDGRGSADAYGSFVATLDHVSPSQVHASDLGFSAAPPPGSGAKTVVVFAGQSNMGGLNQDPSTLPANWQATPAVQIWNPQAHAWQEMQPGFNTGYAGFSSTWGPEVQFAIDFHAAHPNDTLYIVKSVYGGTPLAATANAQDWSPQSSGELFDQTTAEISDASAALGGAAPSMLFWGQGEEDANTQADAAAYGQNLGAFFAAARSQWLHNPNGDIGFFRIGNSPPFSSQVQSAELSVDQADANALSFETSDYPYQSDTLHYSTAGLEKVGDQFYQLYTNWTGGGTSPPPPGPPPPPPPGPPPPPAASGQVLTAHDGGASLVGGSGDDTLIAAHGPDTLTGGAGADRFVYGELPWQPGHVTDFTPGTDKLDLSGLLAPSHYGGSDPIADGYVKLIDDGHGDTWLYFDTDGKGTADQWGTFVATLDHVAPSSIHPSDLVAGSGSPPPPPPGPPPPPPPGAGGQVLTAQSGGSNLIGGAGDDTLNAGTGPDTLTGAGGADHFVFGSVPWTAGQITDLAPGIDKIDVSGLLRHVGYAGADPIADGYLKLLDDGHGDTWLYFDADGHGSADQWGTFVATIQHVGPASLGLSDFIVR